MGIEEEYWKQCQLTYRCRPGWDIVTYSWLPLSEAQVRKRLAFTEEPEQLWEVTEVYSLEISFKDLQEYGQNFQLPSTCGRGLT